MLTLLLHLFACFWIAPDDHEALLAKLDDTCATSWYRDADADGHGNPDDSQTACEPPAGYVAYATDCDDIDAAIHSDATELCDGVDQDCDSTIDEDAADASS